MGLCAPRTKRKNDPLPTIRLEIVPPSEKGQNEEEILTTVK
jgi:hypothetical protein